MYFVMFWKNVGLPPALFFSVRNIFTYYRIIFISFLILFAKEKKSVIAYLKNPVSLPSKPINTSLFFSFHHTNRLSFSKIHFPRTISRLFSSIAKENGICFFPARSSRSIEGTDFFSAINRLLFPPRKLKKCRFCYEKKSVLEWK